MDADPGAATCVGPTAPFPLARDVSALAGGRLPAQGCIEVRPRPGTRPELTVGVQPFLRSQRPVRAEQSHRHQHPLVGGERRAPPPEGSHHGPRCLAPAQRTQDEDEQFRVVGRNTHRLLRLRDREAQRDLDLRHRQPADLRSHRALLGAGEAGSVETLVLQHPQPHGGMHLPDSLEQARVLARAGGSHVAQQRHGRVGRSRGVGRRRGVGLRRRVGRGLIGSLGLARTLHRPAHRLAHPLCGQLRGEPLVERPLQSSTSERGPRGDRRVSRAAPTAYLLAV